MEFSFFSWPLKTVGTTYRGGEVSIYNLKEHNDVKIEDVKQKGTCNRSTLSLTLYVKLNTEILDNSRIPFVKILEHASIETN
jgi:hypothetical protein